MPHASYCIIEIDLNPFDIRVMVWGACFILFGQFNQLQIKPRWQRWMVFFENTFIEQNQGSPAGVPDHFPGSSRAAGVVRRPASMRWSPRFLWCQTFGTQHKQWHIGSDCCISVVSLPLLVLADVSFPPLLCFILDLQVYVFTFGPPEAGKLNLGATQGRDTEGTEGSSEKPLMCRKKCDLSGAHTL